MKIGFLGQTHLGQTLAMASTIRGHKAILDDLWNCDVVMVTQDVEDHGKREALDQLMSWAMSIPPQIPVVLVSQVPPGYTRRWASYRVALYYQVDTIIMDRALLRATFPERIVIGKRHRAEISEPYRKYLSSFECPIEQMSYESAEMVKLAVNFYLERQIEATNELFEATQRAGADWTSVKRGVKGDKRIGAYLDPGKPSEHHMRDVRTIRKLLEEQADDNHERGRRSVAS